MINKQIETASTTEREINNIMKKFEPVGDPTNGIPFSICYRLYTKGFWFFKRYYILKMITSSTETRDSRSVEEYCDGFYKLKDESNWKKAFNNLKEHCLNKNKKHNSNKLSVDLNGYIL